MVVVKIINCIYTNRFAVKHIDLRFRLQILGSKKTPYYCYENQSDGSVVYYQAKFHKHDENLEFYFYFFI